MSEKKHIAIIGGGYTGLTVAYRLTQSGYEVTLYERENCVGGLASGFEMDDIALEKIWHFIYKTDSTIIDLAKELEIKDSLVFHESSVATYFDGKLYSFMTPLDLLKFTPLSIIDRVRTGVVGLYLQHVKKWRPLTKITAYDWMRKMAGKRATDVIWKPLLQGKFGKYYDKVIMSWLWGRIKVRVDSKDSDKGGESLGYFTGSFNILTDALKEKIEEQGGKIITGATVEEVKSEDDGKASVMVNGTSQIFDSVVATVPSHVFAQLIEKNDEVSEEYIKGLASIDYIGAAVMVFTSDQKITPYYWHNINDPEIPFLVFLSNTVLAGEETYQGKNVYYIGFYAQHDHEYFVKDERRIMQEWEEGLKAMFPEFDAHKIREKRLFRFKNAQHIVDMGYEEKIPAYQSPLRNVYLSNFSQIYPDDRGLNYAIQEGDKIAALVESGLKK